MHASRLTLPAFLALLGATSACGGSSAPAAAPPAPSAAAATPAAPSASASDTPSDVAGDPATAAGGTNTFADKLDEAKAGKELGADAAMLLTLAKISPKTHKSLLRSYLYSATAECPAQDVVEIAPVPGLLADKGVKVRAQVYEGLKAAAALAQQRGVAIQVVAGQRTIKDAVRSWNHDILQAAVELAKKAPAAERKDKSFASAARKAVDDGDGPKSWVTSPCDKRMLGGWAVDVQLVAVGVNGKPGAVLVKAGDEADHFTKDTFESTYWDKKKGKSFRKLTEIMSVGHFVRRCDTPYHFWTSPTQDETWRCKLDTESWDPPNRPLPAWE